MLDIQKRFFLFSVLFQKQYLKVLILVNLRKNSATETSVLIAKFGVLNTNSFAIIFA